MLSCQNSNSNISASKIVNNPKSASNAQNSKQAVISFEKTEHDFGKLIQGEQASCTFKYKNTGDAPLVISAVEKACGCTSIEFSKTPVEPGKEGAIKITYDSNGHKGFQNKRIIVKANTNPSENIIRIKALVDTIDNF